MLEITLPDGATLDVQDGQTIEDVAYMIGEGLGDATVAGVFNSKNSKSSFDRANASSSSSGDLVAKETPLHTDGDIEIVTNQSDEYLRVLRHTAAHVFAQALKRLYPDAKLTIGPATEEGFYYDIDMGENDLDESDLHRIEDEMQTIVEEDLAVERIEKPREEALEYYSDNEFKRQILDEEASGDTVTFYRQGEFIDLCKGPHVSSTGEISAFKLLNIAAAYWRGDEENEQLTRVYGTAFAKESQLEEFLEMREKAKERDHRKIGQEMNLFSIQEETGPGLPLYHPNGKAVLNQLSGYMQTLNQKMGCDPVETPHLFKTDLWKLSGHYDNYQDDMFLLEVGDDEYGLKPMNCPGHAMIFRDQAWSYRDLPVRYTEQGKVYRKEQHGELSGLSRVWAFTIDDGHLFVRPDQIEDEVQTIMEQIFQVLETFDLDYEVRLATRPEKSVGSDEIWESAEDQLREVLDHMDIDYGLEDGDGAFYGPKIDFAFTDALGREWDGPTVQLDFNMPDRFDLTYTGEDNEEHRPVMIHRALYGSYERFLMVLIEHYGGKFPTWLAPEQVRILPISDDQMAYAKKVKGQLGDHRVTVEDRSWTVGKKIQQAHEDNVPYMLIVGGNEADAGTVSVRDRSENEQKDVPLEEFAEHLDAEVAEKRSEPDFVQE